jgi:hypothetical protein
VQQETKSSWSKNLRVSYLKYVKPYEKYIIHLLVCLPYEGFTLLKFHEIFNETFIFVQTAQYNINVDEEGMDCVNHITLPSETTSKLRAFVASVYSIYGNKHNKSFVKGKVPRHGAIWGHLVIVLCILNLGTRWR